MAWFVCNTDPPPRAEQGAGGSRHGDAGLLRFFRKKALLAQQGAPARLVPP